MKKILLLDIENLHKTENEILQLLKTYAFVYLVYAKSPIVISLDGLQRLSEFITNKRLVLIKMPKAGPDAADFGLAFLAGQLSIQMDQVDIDFDVMSNDKKFEYIVDLLKIMGFQARQLKKELMPIKNIKSSLESIDPNKNEFKPLILAIQLLIKNQPKQFNSLNNALKSWLKGKAINIKHLIEQLKEYQFIKIKDQNVSYELARMKEALKFQEKRETEKLVVELPKIQEIQTKPHLQRIKIYSNYLSKIMKSKPAKANSLLNSIQSVLRLNNQQATQDFMNILIKQNLVKNENNKLIYNDALILAWSSLEDSCITQPLVQPIINEQLNSEIAS